MRQSPTNLDDNACFADEFGNHMSNNESQDISELSFEDAIASLEHSVRKLEGNSLGLELSLAEYAKASNLIAQCQQKLYGAKSSIEQLKSVTANGKTVTQAWEDSQAKPDEEPKSKRRRPASPSKNEDE